MYPLGRCSAARGGSGHDSTTGAAGASTGPAVRTGALACASGLAATGTLPAAIRSGVGTPDAVTTSACMLDSSGALGGVRMLLPAVAVAGVRTLDSSCALAVRMLVPAGALAVRTLVPAGALAVRTLI